MEQIKCKRLTEGIEKKNVYESRYIDIYNMCKNDAAKSSCRSLTIGIAGMKWIKHSKRQRKKSMTMNTRY